jgi:hypothetical protein
MNVELAVHIVTTGLEEGKDALKCITTVFYNL